LYSAIKLACAKSQGDAGKSMQADCYFYRTAENAESNTAFTSSGVVSQLHCSISQNPALFSLLGEYQRTGIELTLERNATIFTG